MPIYAYKCADCGHSKDVLQKISDAPLTVCPSCGKSTFSKQITAPQFQLKGSGWYVTDFRGGNTPAKPAVADSGASQAKSDAPADSKPAADGKPAADSKPAPAAAAPAPAKTPATE